jgi:hydroxymethylpyrimidine/phosphomethylpyrimidine kinase
MEEKELVLGNLVTAINMLETCPEFALLVPEVRVQLAYALSGAKSRFDVAAIDGRMTVVHGFPRASGMPSWGASDHLARRIIEARKYNAEISAALNFKCTEEIIRVAQAYCAEQGLLFGWLDREREPGDVKELDGASMPWKVKQLFAKYGAIPRLFYEGPGWGKEPLFLALGKDAIEVMSIVVEIARRYRQSYGIV